MTRPDQVAMAEFGEEGTGRARTRLQGNGAAKRLATFLEDTVGGKLPVRLETWDHSRCGPDDAPLSVHLRSPRALRYLLWEPNELGAARAYVNGEIDVEYRGRGLDEALADPRLTNFALAARRATEHRMRLIGRLALLAVHLRVIGPPIGAPHEESALAGRRHGRQRDAAAIAHHYDVGNAFYRLLLDEQMVYSCAYWRKDPAADYGLAEAQRDKLALVCGKLGLAPGQRVLDVGCGWGSFVIHAASRHEVRAVGVTLSARQAEVARERVHSAGLDDLVEIRLQDYRDIHDGPYDAIASIGMAEHVGRENFPIYAAQLRRLLVPGGRLLHHQITSIRRADRTSRRRFIDRYVFPDGELLPVGQVIDLLEQSELEACDVESLREHYVLTLHEWLANLERNWDLACTLTSQVRARAWRIYLAGSAAAFATGRISVHQVLATAPLPDGAGSLPRLRAEWLPDSLTANPKWFDALPRDRAPEGRVAQW